MKLFVKILALTLATLMICTALASCSGGKNPSNDNNTNDGQNDGTNNDGNQTDDQSKEDGEFDMVREEDIRETQVSAKPSFTDAEIEAQLKAGEEILKKIKMMAMDLSSSSITIPAGDYGFSCNGKFVNGVETAILLDNIERPDDKPFTINAEGVTFWFKTTGKPCAHCSRTLQIANSSNIIIKGLTMDAYTADDIEGEVTKIDKDNNRIAIKLYNGTMDIDQSIINLAMAGSEFRINAIKKNGDAIAPLYNVNNGWGPGALQLAQSNNLTPTGEDGEYWITFRNNTLMNTIYTDEWLSTYGNKGTIEVGDGICIIYGTSLLMIDNCKQITLDGVKVYSAKTGFWENGGWGNHLYKDCYFGPRPGTNRILGGEGHMSQGVRHGATYDNVTINYTTDDAINIHGFWAKFKNISGNSATFDFAPVGILAGDKAEILSDDGSTVFTLTVKETPAPTYNYNGFLTSSITFVESIPAQYAANRVRFPANECDGWVIKNCDFENIYQRVLINSGSGTIENCKIKNMGGAIALVSNSASYEGGVMGDIVIKNNVIVNSTNHPGATVIPISQTTNFSRHITTGRITVKDNIFVASGALLSTENVKELLVSGNIVVSPIIYGNEGFEEFIDCLGSTAGAEKTNIRKNLLVGVGYPNTESKDNSSNAISEELYKKIYEFCDHAERDASAVIELVNKKIDEAVS